MFSLPPNRFWRNLGLDSWQWQTPNSKPPWTCFVLSACFYGAEIHLGGLLLISLYFTYSEVTRSLPQEVESRSHFIYKSSLHGSQACGASSCVLAEEGHFLPAKSRRDCITKSRHKTQNLSALYKMERKPQEKTRIHHLCCALSCLDSLWSVISYSSQHT